MYRYSLLVPSTYGQMGEGTVLDHSGVVPGVRHLHFILDTVPIDDLHTSFPCYMASQKLGRELERHLARSALTGLRLGEARVELNDQYLRQHPGTAVPEIVWLKIGCNPMADDFGLDRHANLVVSAAGMRVLDGFRLRDCRIYDAETPPTENQLTEDAWEDARRAVGKLRGGQH